MPNTILTFQTDVALKADAEQRAKVLGISLSEFLRQALEEKIGYRKKNPNPFLELNRILKENEGEIAGIEMDKIVKKRKSKNWDTLLKP